MIQNIMIFKKYNKWKIILVLLLIILAVIIPATAVWANGHLMDHIYIGMTTNKHLFMGMIANKHFFISDNGYTVLSNSDLTILTALPIALGLIIMVLAFASARYAPGIYKFTIPAALVFIGIILVIVLEVYVHSV